jgi:hypothetical protein
MITMHRLVTATLVIFAAATTPSTPVTKVVPYSALSMRVTGHARGSCWTSSIASTRRDAFRCMTGNAIHDPCFTRTPSAVACPDDVVHNSGLLLELTKPLPAPGSPEAAQPWAMVLEGKRACNRATGTVDPDYPFYCEGNSGACSAPNLAKREAAYWVTCATMVDGKPRNVSHPLVTTVYR